MNFAKDKPQIDLYLTLTRKNLDALLSSSVPEAFEPMFQKFASKFKKLEDEYHAGVVDQKAWAQWMLTWGTNFTQNASLV